MFLGHVGNFGQVGQNLVEVRFGINSGKKSGRHFLRHSNCDLWSCCDIFYYKSITELETKYFRTWFVQN